MSSDRPPEPAPGSLAGLSLSIFQDLLANLTHDLVLQAHRAEKLLRTQQQQQVAHLAATNATNGSSGADEDAAIPRMPPGNPLASVPAEILCPRCNLPRHTPETMNQAPVVLENGEKKKYCSKLPFQNVRGQDIYGNPFPSMSGASGTKKSKKDAAAAANGDSPSANTPLTNGDAGDTPAKTGKSSGIVYFKCTSCDQEKVASSRYAAHLEKCLGLSGRKSSRAAMAKMSGSGSGTGSPMLLPADAAGKSGSRKPSPEKNGRSTPVPGDDVSTKGSLSSAPSMSGTAPVSSLATPKKKKKLAAAPLASGDSTAPTSSPQVSKSATPVVPILPAAPTSSGPSSSTPSNPRDSSLPLKKRKRKIENSEDVDVPNSAKLKKPKLAAAPSSGVPIAAAPPSYNSGSLPPDTPKKSTLIKLKAKAASPAPSEPSASPTIQKKKLAKKPLSSTPDGISIKKNKKPITGRPPKLAQAPPAPTSMPGSGQQGHNVGVAGKSVPGKAGPGAMARKGAVGLPAGSGSIQ